MNLTPPGSPRLEGGSLDENVEAETRAEVSPGAPRNECAHSVVSTSDLGVWLLDRRLVGKWLDVRISGTMPDFFHGGKYEGRPSYIMMESAPTNVNASIEVQVGYEQSRCKFRLCHLQHEKTMHKAKPTHMTEDLMAVPLVISTPGTQVVVIGPDRYSDSQWIGYYGKIARCVTLDTQFAYVLLSQEWPSDTENGSYFEPDSLCRSLTS